MFFYRFVGWSRKNSILGNQKLMKRFKYQWFLLVFGGLQGGQKGWFLDPKKQFLKEFEEEKCH